MIDRQRTPDEPDDPVPVGYEELDKGIALAFRGYDRSRSEWGEFYRLIGVDAQGQTRSVGIFHAALRSKIRSARPKPDEKVFIRRLDNRTSGTGRTYRDWSVRMLDRPLLTDLPRCEDDEIDDGLEFDGDVE